MIYILGDSHAKYNFIGFPLEYTDWHESSITMYRIGRDKEFPNLNKEYIKSENTFIFCYGEVDCRCHIGKQIRLGRHIDDVCETLVNAYIEAISSVFVCYKKICICFIVPTMNEEEYHKNHSNFPFIGDEAERVFITRKVNALLQEKAEKKGYLFLDCTKEYSNVDGTLNVELSDKCVHIAKNSEIHKKLIDLIA